MAGSKRPTAAQLTELDELAGQYKALKAAERKSKDDAAKMVGEIVKRMQAWHVNFLPLEKWRITVKTTQRSVDVGAARKVLRLGVLRKILKTVVVMEIWDELRRTGEISDADEAACMGEKGVEPHVYVYPQNAEKKTKTAA